MRHSCLRLYRYGSPVPWTCPECGQRWRVAGGKFIRCPHLTLMCAAKDCGANALSTFSDGAGRRLDLCEEHGDLLAVGFRLRAAVPTTTHSNESRPNP